MELEDPTPAQHWSRSREQAVIESPLSLMSQQGQAPHYSVKILNISRYTSISANISVFAPSRYHMYFYIVYYFWSETDQYISSDISALKYHLVSSNIEFYFNCKKPAQPVSS